MSEAMVVIVNLHTFSKNAIVTNFNTVNCSSRKIIVQEYIISKLNTTLIMKIKPESTTELKVRTMLELTSIYQFIISCDADPSEVDCDSM